MQRNIDQRRQAPDFARRQLEPRFDADVVKRARLAAREVQRVIPSHAAKCYAGIKGAMLWTTIVSAMLSCKHCGFRGR